MNRKSPLQRLYIHSVRVTGIARRWIGLLLLYTFEPIVTLGPIQRVLDPVLRKLEPRSRALAGASLVSSRLPYPRLSLPAVSLVVLQSGIPFFNPTEILQNAGEWLMNGLISGIFNAISNLFILGVSKFLFFRNPADIDSLDVLFIRTVPVALLLLSVSILVFFLMAQIFPERVESDPFRMVERSIYALIALVIARPALALIVTVTHSFSMFLFPEQYSLLWGSALFENLIGGLGSVFAAVLLAVFGSFSMIGSGLLFYGILLLRELLVYMVYGLAPLLAVFWVIDIGPGKYIKGLVDFILSLTGLLLMFGIFSSAILSVGAKVAGFTGTESPTAAESGTLITSAADSVGMVFLKMFTYFGTLWIIIGLTASAVGLAKRFGVNSIGSNPGRRMRSPQSSQAPQAGGGAASSGSGGGGAIGGGGSGGDFPMPGQSQGGVTKGPMQVQTLDNGDLMVMNDQQDGAVFRSDPGIGPTAQTFSDGNVDQAISGEETFASVGSDDIATTEDYEGPMGLSGKATSGVARTRDAIAGGVESVGGTMREQGLDRLGGGVERVGSGIKDYATREGAAAAGYYGATFGGRFSVDEQSGPIHRRLGRGVEGVGRGVKGMTRFVKGGATTYGQMFAEEDPVRSAQIGMNAMRRSPIGDPRRSNVTGEMLASEDPYGLEELRSENPHTVNLISDLSGMEPYAFTKSEEGSQSVFGPQQDGWIDVEKSNGNIVVGDQTSALQESALSREDVDSALKHQLMHGANPQEAVARVGRAVKYDAFDPVGGYSVDEDVASALGTESIPEGLETDTAASRIRLAEDPGVTSGVHAEDMWRYTFSDENKAVFGQDVSGFNYGPQTLVGEESLDKLGVNTPNYHYDPNQEFMRAEGIAGEDLDDIRDAVSSNTEASVDDLSVSPNDINKESYTSAVAGMALVGNHDLNPGNIRFDQNGEATLIDNDDAGLEQLTKQKVDRLSEKGSNYASDMGLDVSEDNIRDSMYDMADRTEPEEISRGASDSAIDRMASGASSQAESSNGILEKEMQVQDASNTIAGNLRKARQRDLPSGNRDSATASSGSAVDGSGPDDEIVQLSNDVGLEAADVENMVFLRTQMEGMSRSEAIKDIRSDN